MEVADHALVLLASLVAGAVNAVAGGGSLLTFPALLAVGLEPVAASVTNTLGLLAGYLGGAHAYRAEIRAQRARVRRLAPPAALGAVAGAAALLLGPESVFEAIVPYLVLGAGLLLAAQPRVSAWVLRHGREGVELPASLLVLVFVGGAYGAYFGGALGVILLAALGAVLADDLQHLNALKSVLSLLINAVAVAVFVFAPQAAWASVGVMAVGSLVGGRIGAGVARRLGATTLRRVVVTFALVVGTILLLQG